LLRSRKQRKDFERLKKKGDNEIVMKVLLRNCHLIDLDQVKFAVLRKNTHNVFEGDIPTFSIWLVFINGKEEVINYGEDVRKAINEFKQFVELLHKGDKND
jgi:hypothetical protein